MTYNAFTNFTPEEIEKHIGVCILNGLSPSECGGLVAVSVYDTKPLHFLTTANNSIQWIEKTRE
eukprot:258423-Ditylum_brightwellii.AAC.1